jgi:hypothetical protein
MYPRIGFTIMQMGIACEYVVIKNSVIVAIDAISTLHPIGESDLTFEIRQTRIMELMGFNLAS